MSETPPTSPIGIPQIRRFTEILQRYRTAKAAVDARYAEAERWWRLRNTGEEGHRYALARDGGITAPLPGYTMSSSTSTPMRPRPIPSR